MTLTAAGALTSCSSVFEAVTTTCSWYVTSWSFGVLGSWASAGAASMSRTPAAARRTIIKVTLLAGACGDEQRSLWGSGAENASNPHGMISVRAPVAQLDRAPDFESVGRRFESCRARQQNANSKCKSQNAGCKRGSARDTGFAF